MIERLIGCKKIDLIKKYDRVTTVRQSYYNSHQLYISSAKDYVKSAKCKLDEWYIFVYENNFKFKYCVMIHKDLSLELFQEDMDRIYIYKDLLSAFSSAKISDRMEKVLNEV